MKTTAKLLCLILLFPIGVSFAQTGINDDNSEPDPSAMLDVKSTDKGMLVPRMTETERDNISGPATGLLVYVTTDNCFYYYNGSDWQKISRTGDNGWTVSGDSLFTRPDSVLTVREGRVGIKNTNPSFDLDIGTDNARIRSSNYAQLSLVTDNVGGWVGSNGNAGYAYLGTYTGHDLRFFTNNSSRMVVKNDGKVGIGTTNPTEKLHVAGGNILLDVNGKLMNAGGSSIQMWNDIWMYSAFNSYVYVGNPLPNPTGGGVMIDSRLAQFRTPAYGNVTMHVDMNQQRVGIRTISPGYALEVNGDAAKPGGGSWLASSDERLKDIHGSFNKGLEELALLSPRYFSYKKGNAREHSSDENYIGFTAQEVQQVFPEAVKTGDDGYLSLDMHVLNVAVINALKELKTENEKLRQRIEVLEMGR